MTHEEKAKELVDKFTFMRFDVGKHVAKESALIAVDEILNLINELEEGNWLKVVIGESVAIPSIEYWQKVKESINNE